MIKLEKTFFKDELECRVYLTSMGHRCGYVCVPDFINCDDIVCHGGITYCENEIHDGFSKDGYKWIGFDCMHGFDMADLNALKETFPFVEKSHIEFIEFIKSMRQDRQFPGKIWTTEMVVKECLDIVSQVEEIIMQVKDTKK